MLFFPLVIYELLLLLDKFEYSEGALLQNAVALAGDVRFVPEIKRTGIMVPVFMAYAFASAESSVVCQTREGLVSTGLNPLTEFYAMFFNLPEVVDSVAVRLRAKAIAALIKAVNSGWPALGVEVNSG